MKLTILTPLLTAAILLSATSNAQALLIDSFDTTSQTLSTNATGISQSSSPTTSPSGSEAVGDSRELTLSVTSVGAFGGVIFDTNVTKGGKLKFQELNAQGSFSIFWDGSVDGMFDEQGLGGADLTNQGAFDRFAIHANVESSSPIPISVTFYATDFDMTGAKSEATITFTTTPTDIFVSRSVLLEHSVNNFTATNGGVDFASIGAIELSFVGTPLSGDNFEIDLIQTLPEPSSFALLGMGALSLVGYGWRRKKRLVA